MSQIFFDKLGLPKPNFFLKVGSGSHGFQTAQVIMHFEKLIMENHPDLVIVVGDVNSTLGASLASAKLGIPVAHVEAGLRSFDMKMPKEINRILTDRISNLLFASEPSAMENLKREGVKEALNQAMRFDKSYYTPPKLWDGKAAERIVENIINYLQ